MDKKKSMTKKSDVSTDVSTRQKTKALINISVLVMMLGSLVLAGGIFFSFSRSVTPKKVTTPVSLCPIISSQQIIDSDNNQELLQKMIVGDCSSSLVNREGILYITIAENFKTGKILTSYSLYEDGQTIPLYLSGISNSKLTHGDVISVTGYSIDSGQALLLDVNNIIVSADKSINPHGPIIGQQEVLIVRAEFSNSNEVVPSLSSVRSAIEVVDEFYQENSYDTVDFVGVENPDNSADIIGSPPIPLDMVKPTTAGLDCNDTAAVMDYVYTGVVDYLYENNLVDLQQYDENGKLVMVVPTGCWWGGLGRKGFETIALPNGETASMSVVIIGAEHYYSTSNLLSPLSHELGHTFGHDHAAFYGCNIFNSPFDPENCDLFNEYGDYFEVMGNLGVRHYNAKHKQESGWLTEWDSNTGEGKLALVTEQTVTSDGLYTLEPIESNTNGLKIIKLPRANSDEYLYVEFRQPIGFDTDMTSYYNNNNVYNGALLHIDAEPLDTYYGTVDFSYLFLPDGARRVNPYRFEGYPALELDDSFNDPESYTTVRVESVDIDEEDPANSRLTVKIIFNDIQTDINDCIDGTPVGQCDEVGDNGRLCIGGALIESDCLTCGCPSDFICDSEASGGPTCVENICTDSYTEDPNVHPGSCTDALSSYAGVCSGGISQEYFCSNGSGQAGTCLLRQFQTTPEICDNNIDDNCNDLIDTADNSCTCEGQGGICVGTQYNCSNSPEILNNYEEVSGSEYYCPASNAKCCIPSLPGGVG